MGRVGASLVAPEQAVAVVVLVGDAGAVVRDGDRHQLGPGIDRDGRLDGRAPAVVDGVVEDRPQHLVQLVRVREREPAGGAVVQREGHVRRAQGLPGPPDAGRGREHLQPGPQRPGLDPAHGQQLADHPRQPVGLLRDDPEAAVRGLRGQLLGVAADAGQRGLEVVRDAPEEVVLGLVQAQRAAGSGPPPARTAGRCGGRRRPRWRTAPAGPGRPAPSGAWPAGAPRPRRAGCRPPRAPPARAPGRPGTTSSTGISRGSTSRISQSIIPKASRAWAPAWSAIASGRSRRVIPSRASRIRRSSRFLRSRFPASRLWLSARRLNSSSPGSSRRVARSPAETRSTDEAIARRGAPRSAARIAASRTANTTATATANRRTRVRLELASPVAPAAPVARMTTMPKAATGRTAATMRPSVRRVRKPSPALR